MEIRLDQWYRRYALPLRQEVVRPQRTKRKRTISQGGYALPLLLFYGARGGLRQVLARVVQSPAEGRHLQ
jgi:hypothetical protein